LDRNGAEGKRSMSKSYETGVCVAGLSCYLGIFGGLYCVSVVFFIVLRLMSRLLPCLSFFL
jgi:hypothetical protein